MVLFLFRKKELNLLLISCVNVCYGEQPILPIPFRSVRFARFSRTLFPCFSTNRLVEFFLNHIRLYCASCFQILYLRTSIASLQNQNSKTIKFDLTKIQCYYLVKHSIFSRKVNNNTLSLQTCGRDVIFKTLFLTQLKTQ